MTRPPLREVARRAGVSEPTVSRVLNGRYGVAKATRDRVVAALGELGFTDVPPAGSAARGAVGIVCGELSNPVFPALVHSVSDRLARHGIVSSVGVVATDLHPEDRYVQEFIDVNVDGIVFIAGRHAERSGDLEVYRQLVERNTPFVLVNGGDTGLDVPHVWSDESIAAERSVDHLVALGHRLIGCVLGPRRYLSTHRFIDGFHRAMDRNDVALPEFEIAETAFTFEGGRAAAVRLIEAGATALICANDLMAMGAIAACRAAGSVVALDVSIVGYDGTDFTATADPPLTTLRQPFEDMGDIVADALMSEINGSRRFRDRYVFAPELVARSSTGPLPSQLTSL